MSVLMLQLEAAARERVQRSDRQEEESAQVPCDLQVFLHSTAQFGPASMRELMVGQSLSFPSTQIHTCDQASKQLGKQADVS